MTADFGFSDPNDSPADAFASVKITTLPTAGALQPGRRRRDPQPGDQRGRHRGRQAGLQPGRQRQRPQLRRASRSRCTTTAAPPTVGSTSTPAPTPSPSTSPASTTRPRAATTRSPSWKTAATSSTADFGFSDPNDSPADAFASVKITSLPTAGALELDGVGVTLNQEISVADIVAGKLVFSPAANANGLGYADFTFQVQDDGGTDDGGIDLDPSANTITLDVTSVNDAPSGSDDTITILEDGSHVFVTADFGFSDPNDSPADAFASVKITTLPTAGALELDGGRRDPQPGDQRGRHRGRQAGLQPGRQRQRPQLRRASPSRCRTTVAPTTVAIDLDPSANTITVNVTSVNDAPSGSDDTVTILETAPRLRRRPTSASAIRTTARPTPSPASRSPRCRPPARWSSTGSAVNVGQVISVADIAAGKLVFSPAANANGAATPSFTFQVHDDGGTANGGDRSRPERQHDDDRRHQRSTTRPSGADNTVTILRGRQPHLRGRRLRLQRSERQPGQRLRQRARSPRCRRPARWSWTASA